jgi:uncharacterized protein (DUF2141 family)
VHTALGDVTMHADELTDLGDIELIAHCDGPPTGLSGRIEVDIEEGPARSARPVRLALMPLDEGERRALPLFDAHDTLDGTPGHFSRRVPPGRYRARIYVDTDRDGELRRCDTDPFGDRAASEPFDIEITPDTITRLDAPIPVRTLGCPLPAVTLAPRIALDALAADGPLPAAIELHLAETGGWTATYTLPLAPDIAPLLAIDLAPLAPGRYRLTAYVDGDADGELDPCDAPTPDPYQTRIEFTLDANNPTADPLLRPEPCAP